MKKILLSIMFFVATTQTSQQSVFFDLYKTQMQQLVDQLETAIANGGDDLEESLNDVISTAKMILSFAQAKCAEQIENIKEALDILAKSENKAQVATNFKDIAQGSIFWADSVRAMFNANLMIIMAAQQLVNEHQAQKAALAESDVTNN